MKLSAVGFLHYDRPGAFHACHESCLVIADRIKSITLLNSKINRFHMVCLYSAYPMFFINLTLYK